MDRRLLDLPFTFHGICVALILIVVVDAQGLPDLCVPQAKVQKKSYSTVSSKSPLKISCPVTYCEEIPTVGWIKISDMDEWTLVNETDEITITQEQSDSVLKKLTSHLNFKSISKNDSGFYRCVISAFNCSSQSHSINVSVLDGSTVPTTIYGTNSSAVVNNKLEQTEDTSGNNGWLPYVFICLGILGVVTIVMVISFLSIYGCRWTKFYRQQYAPSGLVPPNQSLSQHNGKTEQTNKVPEMEESHLCSLYPGMGQGHTLPRTGDLQNYTGSSSQQIVYATLEHLPARTSSGPGYQLREQFSEYASIRIC